MVDLKYCRSLELTVNVFHENKDPELALFSLRWHDISDVQEFKRHDEFGLDDSDRAVVTTYTGNKLIVEMTYKEIKLMWDKYLEWAEKQNYLVKWQ